MRFRLMDAILFTINSNDNNNIKSSSSAIDNTVNIHLMTWKLNWLVHNKRIKTNRYTKNNGNIIIETFVSNREKNRCAFLTATKPRYKFWHWLKRFVCFFKRRYFIWLESNWSEWFREPIFSLFLKHSFACAEKCDA